MAMESREHAEVVGFVRYLATGRGIEGPKPVRFEVLHATAEPLRLIGQSPLPATDGDVDPEPGSFRVPPAAA